MIYPAEIIPHSTVESIELAIAMLEKLHPKGCCIIGNDCEVRGTIHRLRNELNALGLSEVPTVAVAADELPAGQPNAKLTDAGGQP